MTEYIQIHWTSGGLDEARLVARHLVEKRLVACASIIPWVESLFIWEGQMDTCQESKVIFKTRKELFDEVRKTILQLSKYEVPEILAVPIVEGNTEYLDWISNQTAAYALD